LSNQIVFTFSRKETEDTLDHKDLFSLLILLGY